MNQQGEKKCQNSIPINLISKQRPSIHRQSQAVTGIDTPFSWLFLLWAQYCAGGRNFGFRSKIKHKTSGGAKNVC